jgi:hypothetical protein
MSDDHKEWMWTRLYRESTDSYMSVCLGPWELNSRMVDGMIARNFSGWEPLHYGMGCCDQIVPDLCPDWPDAS